MIISLGSKRTFDAGWVTQSFLAYALTLVAGGGIMDVFVRFEERKVSLGGAIDIRKGD